MKRFRIALPVIVGLSVGFVGMLGLLAGLFDTVGSRVTDRFFLPRTADPSAIIVAIDDASLGRIGRWPWPRSVHAQLIDRLREAGAKVIALDVNFPEPSDTAADTALATSLKSARNVVLPVELDFVVRGNTLVFDSKNTVQPIALIQAESKAAGFSNIPLDTDGVARRLPTQSQGLDGSQVVPFAYETARLAGRAPEIASIPLDRSGRMLINFPASPRKAFPIVSAADVIQGRVDAARLKDKVVFIGATARDLHDQQNVATSFGDPMSGVEIHASVYDTLVQRKWLVPVSLWIQGLLLLLVGLLLGLLVPRVKARASAIVALVIWLGWIITSFVLFDRGYVLDIVWISLVVFFGYMGLLLERWLETDAQRKQIRAAFTRYVSPSVVEQLVREPERLKLGGDRRRMSVLFSDLRGFTTLSEGLTPEQLVDVLNTYLNEMTNIVFEEGGVLDKYIGDAVMAFWNAPLDQADHAARSVRTAIRMRDKLEQMNKEGAFPKGIELKVGVGVNTGDMVVGNIGADVRYDYTVIGDSVNLASRTESLCKEYGVQIIITKNTLDMLDESYITRELDSVAVKGKKEPVRIFQVLGMAGEVEDSHIKFAKQFETALNHYYGRNFTEAAAECENLLQIKPDDLTTQHLLERCHIYQETPPPADWNGAWVMTKK
ncbi:adenylate/guanylate cyclase domain-containing protein [Candidatus Uhrbacteria bacterium]|nr:MAG: adenylate/guanylate cyclase domain-containing protein [Candidatus Uhrbacteria bacterium]